MSSGSKRVAAIAAVVVLIGALGYLLYRRFSSTPIPAMSFNYAPQPAIVDMRTEVTFSPKQQGEKLTCFGKIFDDEEVKGVQYFNLAIVDPKGEVSYVKTTEGALIENFAQFRFSFWPKEAGDYLIYPCRIAGPEKGQRSEFVVRAENPKVQDSQNKPPAATGAPQDKQSETKTIDEKLKVQIADAVTADLKKRGLLLSEADRSKLDEARAAKARVDAAEAIARSAKADLEAARRELATKVPNTDFKPVLERGIENAKTLKEHAEQMEVWKNDLASVKETADTAQKDVGTVLAEQSIQKENIKSVAAVTLELAKDVQGTVHTKVNKTFGFIGGTEIKDTKEFKKVVDYRKQREDLASKIAELERIAGRYQNVVAQAPDATNSKKMKKRQ